MKINNFKLRTLMVVVIVLSVAMLGIVQLVYYVQFAALRTQQTETYTLEMTSQVKGQMDNLVDNITTTAESISYSKHLQEFFVTTDLAKKYVELGPLVMDLLNYPKSSNNQIMDIFAVDLRGNIVTPVQSFGIGVMDQIMKKEDLAASYSRNPGFTSCVKYKETWYFAYIHPIINASAQSTMFSCLGYCVVLVATDSICDIMLNVSVTPNSQFFLVNEENRIVAGNVPENIGTFFNEQGIFDGYHSDSIMLQEQDIDTLGWRAICFVPQSDLVSDMQPIFRNGLILAAILTLILLVIGGIFVYNVNSSLFRLLKFLQSIEGIAQIKDRVRMNTTNEIGIISSWIDRMLDRLEEMTQKIVQTQSQLYDAEISRTRMELSMLQNLINPHFLYNTLNCISSIGLANDIPDVVTMSSAVSRIFRYSIDSRDTVTVREEINCIHEFMKIMNIRYDNKFITMIEVAPGLEDKLMPKMILQPIVENAIYHGIEPKRGKGHLTIRCIQKDEDILFQVCDDGKGMSAEELERLRTRLYDQNAMETISAGDGHTRIGMANIHRRIRLIYKGEYGISVESELDQGTVVTIRFPIRTG